MDNNNNSIHHEEDHHHLDSNNYKQILLSFNKITIISIIAIILSLVIAIIGIIAFAAALIAVSVVNSNNKIDKNNNLQNNNLTITVDYESQLQNKPLLFHISDKTKFSVGLGNIQNLYNMLQNDSPYITIISNSDAVSEYFNNATIPTMKMAVDNYRTQIKCCRIALTKYLISSGKCVNDNATINLCVDQVIVNEMPKFVTVVPSGIVYINANYAKFRYIKP
ncbi:hypothetical protein ABK040_016685 [Willaertia magna]